MLFIHLSFLIRFYGVIVASQDRCTQNSNQDLQAQYPDLRSYPGVNSYYVTAGWNNATDSSVPTSLTIGNKASFSAVLNGETQSFYNAPLSRETFYCIFVVIHQSTGVPGVCYLSVCLSVHLSSH